MCDSKPRSSWGSHAGVIACIFIHTYYKAAPLCFKGKAGWDTRLASYKGSLEQLNPLFNQDAVMDHDGNKRLMFIAQCPACEKQSPSNDYKFQYTDLGKKINAQNVRNSDA